MLMSFFGVVFLHSLLNNNIFIVVSRISSFKEADSEDIQSSAHDSH